MSVQNVLGGEPSPVNWLIFNDFLTSSECRTLPLCLVHHVALACRRLYLPDCFIISISWCFDVFLKEHSLGPICSFRRELKFTENWIISGKFSISKCEAQKLLLRHFRILLLSELSNNFQLFRWQWIFIFHSTEISITKVKIFMQIRMTRPSKQPRLPFVWYRHALNFPEF